MPLADLNRRHDAAAGWPNSLNRDRHRINQQILPGRNRLNDAVANARGLVLQNVPLSARQSALERTLPLLA